MSWAQTKLRPHCLWMWIHLFRQVSYLDTGEVRWVQISELFELPRELQEIPFQVKADVKNWKCCTSCRHFSCRQKELSFFAGCWGVRKSSETVWQRLPIHRTGNVNFWTSGSTIALLDRVMPETRFSPRQVNVQVSNRILKQEMEGKVILRWVCNLSQILRPVQVVLFSTRVVDCLAVWVTRCGWIRLSSELTVWRAKWLSTTSRFKRNW